MQAIEGKENAVDFIENYKFDEAVLEWFDWYIETHLEYKLSDDENPGGR
ncbi:hypothetical protein [Pseudoalteromonas maricaloris]